VRYLARTERDTEELGARLARARPESGQLSVLFLTGQLGSGKTTFARGVLRALGLATTVRSPTYTLVELYPDGSAPTAVHVDLYRLADPSELQSLGLRDFARPSCLWLVEWPERGRGHLPPPDITLSFGVGSEGHTIDLVAHSAFGERWVREFETH
jgi:tRNA threonylcarbamoyladenosine biosynthesis protein TsaE